uniref:ABC transporter domain-containing protein n=1 Tax=Cannabis sativa TaxID=3483 RepID=A0A803QL16_CANSA
MSSSTSDLVTAPTSSQWNPFSHSLISSLTIKPDFSKFSCLEIAEYNSIVSDITSRSDALSIEKVQTLILSHESRLKHHHAMTDLSVKMQANLAFGNGRTGGVKGVSYQPPGTQHSLLNEVNFSLPEKSFGLIFGRSGSGKTTLLQLLAGLSKPTSGSICIQRYGNDGHPSQPPEPLPSERVGIVFQFPERYFVADNVFDEVTFGWPRQKADLQVKEHLALRLQQAINWVGLNGILLDKDPQSLSGGYKRRLALAIQLVQIPDLLILDEPLAGLEATSQLQSSPSHVLPGSMYSVLHSSTYATSTVIFRELAGLVDRSWVMEMGGNLREEQLPI